MAFLPNTDIFLHHGAHCKLSVNFQVGFHPGILWYSTNRLCFVVSTYVQSRSSPAKGRKHSDMRILCFQFLEMTDIKIGCTELCTSLKALCKNFKKMA